MSSSGFTAWHRDASVTSRLTALYDMVHSGGEAADSAVDCTTVVPDSSLPVSESTPALTSATTAAPLLPSTDRPTAGYSDSVSAVAVPAVFVPVPATVAVATVAAGPVGSDEATEPLTGVVTR